MCINCQGMFCKFLKERVVWRVQVQTIVDSLIKRDKGVITRKVVNEKNKCS